MILAVPKLHKNPNKFRLIAGASKSSMKPLSVLLNRILMSWIPSHENGKLIE